MKETYDFDFNDTPLTLKMEEMVEILESLDPDNMTTAELLGFAKLDLKMLEIRDEFLNHCAAIAYMYTAIEQE